MKWPKAAVILIVVVSGVMASTAAFAHRGRVHFGIAIGAPYWYYPSPYYYYPPYPYYYYPPVVTVPSSPPVYIERNDAAATERSTGYWYYCPDTKTYYPYVKECASPWQRVEPQPRNP